MTSDSQGGERSGPSCFSEEWGRHVTHPPEGWPALSCGGKALHLGQAGSINEGNRLEEFPWGPHSVRASQGVHVSICTKPGI